MTSLPKSWRQAVSPEKEAEGQRGPTASEWKNQNFPHVHPASQLRVLSHFLPPGLFPSTWPSSWISQLTHMPWEPSSFYSFVSPLTQYLHLSPGLLACFLWKKLFSSVPRFPCSYVGDNNGVCLTEWPSGWVNSAPQRLNLHKCNHLNFTCPPWPRGSHLPTCFATAGLGLSALPITSASPRLT